MSERYKFIAMKIYFLTYLYKNTSGRLNISPSTAKTLNWEHGDEINYLVKEFNGKLGLFFFKKEEEKSYLNSKQK